MDLSKFKLANNIMNIINLIVFFWLKKYLSKSFNETDTPWLETNCLIANATDFSPINIKTRLVECN